MAILPPEQYHSRDKVTRPQIPLRLTFYRSPRTHGNGAPKSCRQRLASKPQLSAAVQTRLLIASDAEQNRNIFRSQGEITLDIWGK